jgi:hypothetical protein
VTRRPTTAGPGSTGSWQSTPRAAHQPSPSGLGLAVILLCWFSPLSLAAWLVGQLLILMQKRWHWHRFALAALAFLAYVLLVIGPEQALRRHFYVHQHFWQYVALLLGFGPPGATLSIRRVAHDVVLTQLWLGVPLGLLAAALAVYFAEHAAGGESPWDGWRLHRLEGKMESWQTPTVTAGVPTPPSGGTRLSCVIGLCAWCWTPLSRPAGALA